MRFWPYDHVAGAEEELPLVVALVVVDVDDDVDVDDHPDHVAGAKEELPGVPRGHLPGHRLARTGAWTSGLAAGRHHPTRQIFAEPSLSTSRPDQVWTSALRGCEGWQGEQEHGKHSAAATKGG